MLHERFAVAFRRSRRGNQQPITLEKQPDALPKRGLFADPVRVHRLTVMDPEPLDGDHRVTFMAEIRDVEDKRCSNISVEARVVGPHRESTVQGTTDLLGRIRFRMRGPVGSYRIEITDVAAGGLDWDRNAGVNVATTSVT